MPANTGFWTTARTEQLLALWLSGKQGTEIGVILGCTRSTVMGRLARLRAHDPTIPNRRRVVPRPNVLPSTRRHRLRAKTKRTHAAPKPTTVLSPDTPYEPIKPIEQLVKPVKPVKLINRNWSTQCGWIVGAEGKGPATLMCGAPQFDKSGYCEQHHRIGRVPNRKDDRETARIRLTLRSIGSHGR